MRHVNIKEAARLLQAGGLVIYPTETFCAIGARSDNAEANAAICAVKNRPPQKPLPILAANREQAALAADLAAAPEALMARFWPGPLSLVLPARPGAAPQVLDAAKRVCLRVTSSPLAAALAQATGMTISCSSANPAGKAPVHAPAELDRELLARCAACPLPFALLQGEAGSGFLPSTIVLPARHSGGWRLEILRTGAIAEGALRQACE